jgi:hypothetical protein
MAGRKCRIMTVSLNETQTLIMHYEAIHSHSACGHSRTGTAGERHVPMEKGLTLRVAAPMPLKGSLMG